MLSKGGDLENPSNWRPIAILYVLYKLFSRLIYNRISPGLFAAQSFDQHAFTPGLRIEDALFCAESTIEYAQEFRMPLWLMSMDMRKAFDSIEYAALFEALSNHGIDDAYILLI